MKNYNISNIYANYVLTPISIAVLYFLGSRANIVIGTESLAIFLVIYFYCSTFYQPDLDQEVDRPKREYFPHGKTITRLPYFKRWVSKLFRPINRAWYYYWHPYGNLFTHRGISHWPLISVALRNTYLFLPVIILHLVFKHPGVVEVYDFYKSSLPWNVNLNSKTFLIYILPIYMSDINHIVIDFAESVAKGNSFCPPKLKRGYIAQLFLIFK